MQVSVVLIAFYSDKWLPQCVDTIQLYNRSSQHLILVDNEGNNLLNEIKFKSGLTLLKTSHPMGFAEANNFALTQAKQLGEYIVFLNQDTISQAGWLDRCVDCLEQAPELGAISPVIRNYDDTAYDPSFLDCLPERTIPHSDGQDWFEVKHAPAPALVVRKEVLMQTGPFDPIFGSYYEDYDLCYRIRSAGYKIGVCREAVIQHYSGSTTDTRGKELRRMRQILRNRLIYQLRTSERPRWQLLLRYFLMDMPHRLLRGILRTSSAQPPRVVLQANGDILKLVGRIVSEKRDQQAWQQYLQSINWQFTQSETPASIEDSAR